MRTVILGLLLLGVSAVRGAQEEALPRDWYVLPEDAGMALRETSAPTRNADRAIERVIRTNSKALDDLAEEEGKIPALSRGGNWELSSLNLSLGLSASGVLGVLLVGGDVSAGLSWRRGPSVPAPELTDRAADVVVHGEDSVEKTRGQLEPVVRAVMATGSVGNEDSLRKNLLATALKYQALLAGLSSDPRISWQVSRLEVEFSVDVSGQVAPVVSVGGGVRLRFEWRPAARVRYQADGPLDRLVRAIESDLQSLDLDALAPTGFQLRTLRFGLGIFGDGKVGVVKVGASAMGSLFLTRREVPGPLIGPPSDLPPEIPLIASSAPAAHLRYARETGIRFLQTRDGSTVYYVPRGLFRKGLQRAVKIGSYLAERASRSEGKKWTLSGVNASFALSLGGSVGIVSLGGTASLYLGFKKKGVVCRASE